MVEIAPNPRLQDERLDALYAKLPKIDCQGLCYDSCGPIAMSVRERSRLERAAGRKCHAENMTCSLLENGRCAAYEVRPTICRLWGLVESMRCPYGCKPERVLTDAEAFELLAEADKIGGASSDRERELYEQLREFLQDSDMREVEERARLAARAVIARPSLAGREPSLRKSILHRR